jgi:hypothetical protein
VHIDGTSSKLQQLSCGVPQGSLLGPLLFLCYTNDMETSVCNKLLLYAHDSVLVCSHKDPEVISNSLSSDFNSCNNWLINNHLSLHVGKTECILFGIKAKLSRIINPFKFCLKIRSWRGRNPLSILELHSTNISLATSWLHLLSIRLTVDSDFCTGMPITWTRSCGKIFAHLSCSVT